MSNRSNPSSARRFQDSCSMHAWAFLPLLLHQVAMPKPVSPGVHAKDDQHAKQASNVAANSSETRMAGLYAPSTPSHEHSIHVGFHATEHPTECLRVAQQAGANVYGKPHPGDSGPFDAQHGALQRSKLQVTRQRQSTASDVKWRRFCLDKLSGLGFKKFARCLVLDLSSFRPGGATWLPQASDNPELVRRRGRWLSPKVMEIYLQEVQFATFVGPDAPKQREDCDSGILFL